MPFPRSTGAGRHAHASKFRRYQELQTEIALQPARFLPVTRHRRAERHLEFDRSRPVPCPWNPASGTSETILMLVIPGGGGGVFTRCCGNAYAPWVSTASRP